MIVSSIPVNDSHPARGSVVAMLAAGAAAGLVADGAVTCTVHPVLVRLVQSPVFSLLQGGDAPLGPTAAFYCALALSRVPEYFLAHAVAARFSRGGTASKFFLGAWFAVASTITLSLGTYKWIEWTPRFGDSAVGFTISQVIETDQRAQGVRVSFPILESACTSVSGVEVERLWYEKGLVWKSSDAFLMAEAGDGGLFYYYVDTKLDRCGEVYAHARQLAREAETVITSAEEADPDLAPLTYLEELGNDAR